MLGYGKQPRNYQKEEKEDVMKKKTSNELAEFWWSFDVMKYTKMNQS